MSILEHAPRATYALRQHRRHEIVTTGGMDGVLRVGAALTGFGFAVRDFAVDVRDGVPYSYITCTASLTSEESEAFAERLRELPVVVAVDAC